MRAARWALGSAGTAVFMAGAVALLAGDSSGQCNKSCPPSQRVNGCCTAPPPAATPKPPPGATPSAGACPAGMVSIPGGSFLMGSPDNEPEAEADEKPQHKVTVSSFCMARTETTVAQYQACVAAGRCKPAPTTVASGGFVERDKFWSKFCNAGRNDRRNHPINCVDWTMADVYCQWTRGRLPTEEEWEYAARGGGGRKYPWGSDAPDETRLNAFGSDGEKMYTAMGVAFGMKALHGGDDGWGSTAPAGTYPKGATPEGLLDMAGNVGEWTASRWCEYSSNSCQESWRVIRGGSWNDFDASSVRAAHRRSSPKSFRASFDGFRCARTP